jgi:hypothetical protein
MEHNFEGSRKEKIITRNFNNDSFKAYLSETLPAIKDKKQA